jgi:hypothetical protein
VLVCVAAFDELGVDGVYKVMKAERLSRKSLTEGVALSLAEFESGSRWIYTSVRWAFQLVVWYEVIEEGDTGVCFFSR